MRFNRTFLHSKVARRIFTLFILCAFIPITALSIVSFVQVTKQLNEQSKKKLHQASKAIGMAIFERLIFIESELRLTGSNLNLRSVIDGKISLYNSNEHLKKLFSGLSLVTDTGGYVNIFGKINYTLPLTVEEKKHIASGKTLLLSKILQKGGTRLFMIRALNQGHSYNNMLIGEINTSYLWDIVGGTNGDGDGRSILPTSTELCILTNKNDILFCSFKDISSFPDGAVANARMSSGQFEWRYGDKDYMAGYWTIFLKPSFFHPMWTVVLSESKEDVLAPMNNFSKTFPLIILLSIWVIAYLSTSQIRRSLVPLEKLKEGTKRIGIRDFKSKVLIKSGDEFEELADSFNIMADRLGRQFRAMSTMNKIDRTILSQLNTKIIIDTVLKHTQDISHCSVIGITIPDNKNTGSAKTYIRDGRSGEEKVFDAGSITAGDMERFRENPEMIQTDLNDDPPHYITPILAAIPDIRSFLILPIFLKERLSGIITMGYIDRQTQDEDDFIYARQLADQVAVALSNAGMIEELKDINWGILKTLSRMIDAKSPWTAGHSERVTALALEIGKTLCLTEKELDCLRRAGLLHDIGKIGILDSLLDKAGKLSDKEFDVIKKHSVTGADILEPISQFSELISPIRHHHERFDGKGYPDGLKRYEIPLFARILAIADTFDAMTSDRPYRRALEKEYAIAEIKKFAGTQFDPTIVEAFTQGVRSTLLTKKWIVGHKFMRERPEVAG